MGLRHIWPVSPIFLRRLQPLVNQVTVNFIYDNEQSHHCEDYYSHLEEFAQEELIVEKMNREGREE